MKNAVIIIFLVLFSNLYGQKSKFSPSKWNVSGKEELDIPLDNFQYLSKGKIYYYISNDEENIYLDMRIDDSEAQNKILKQGLTIWINDDNKKVKKYGIRFPIGSQYPVRPEGQFQQTQSETAGFNPGSPISRANAIELSGFVKQERRLIPSKNEDNFSGSVHYNNEGVLIYKMIMPVSRIETGKNISTDPITLGIEPGSFLQMRPGSPQGGTSPQASSGPPSGGGGRGGGGGRPSGGMGGGGFSGSGGASPAQTSQPLTFWIKDITLAAEK